MSQAWDGRGRTNLWTRATWISEYLKVWIDVSNDDAVYTKLKIRLDQVTDDNSAADEDIIVESRKGVRGLRAAISQMLSTYGNDLARSKWMCYRKGTSRQRHDAVQNILLAAIRKIGHYVLETPTITESGLRPDIMISSSNPPTIFDVAVSYDDEKRWKEGKKSKLKKINTWVQCFPLPWDHLAPGGAKTDR